MWVEEESADLVLQGEEAGALLQALVGSTEWVAGHRTGIPAYERVIRIPFRMVQILRRRAMPLNAQALTTATFAELLADTHHMAVHLEMRDLYATCTPSVT